MADPSVQPPNSRIDPKSIGEGASSLLGDDPGSRATPRLHPCKSGAALEQETFSSLPGHPTCSFSYRFRVNPGIRGLYQAISVATLHHTHTHTVRQISFPSVTLSTPSGSHENSAMSQNYFDIVQKVFSPKGVPRIFDAVLTHF